MPRLRHSLPPFFLLSALLTTVLAAHKLPFKLFPVSFPRDHSDQLNFLDTATLFRTVDDDGQPEIITFEPTRQILIKEFDLDTFVSFSFRPEPNRNITDYTPVIQCQFPHVLNTSDVRLAPPLLMADGRANYTASLSFEGAVGPASLTILFQRQDRSVYTTVSFQYTVCGISFYYLDGDKRIFLPDSVLTIPSYRDVVNRQVYLFYCFIQFPDGSTSQRLVSDTTAVPPLETIDTDVKGDNIIPTHNFANCKQPPHLKNGKVILPESCPFGFTPSAQTSEPYFAVRLLRYRSGSVTFRFVWPEFLAGFKSGEVYETILTISVAGKAETSVIAVTPNSPFRRAGGQLLRCTLINASPSDSYVFKLGDHPLRPVSVHAHSELVIATFVTPKGSGQNIPWDLKTEKQDRYVSCPWASEEARFVFNYVVQDIFIESLSPSFGPVVGGATVTCAGYFTDFSLEKGDQLILGTYRLEGKYFLSITETSIVFRLPPKSVVNVHSFEVVCYVIVRGIRSNEMKFVFESLSAVRISVAGASFHAQNDTHMIPFCARSDSSVSNASLDLFAHVNSGVSFQFLEFRWHLIILSTKQDILTVSGGAEAQSLTLSLRKLSVANVYKALVIIRDKRFQTQVTSSAVLQPTYSRMLGIGISMDPTRTLTSPPVDSRVIAWVSDLGQCFGANKQLAYEWTFLSKKTSLSYESEDVDRAAPSPRRLGREFIIPQEFLRYGEHEVHLKVFHSDNPDAYGAAVGKLSIEPAPLKAVIGSGESMLRVSSTSGLTITGSKSYDQDSPSLTGHGLMYEWRCELSTEGGMQFASSVDCPSNLIPGEYSRKESFVIPPSHLQTVKPLNGSTYLRFSLHVRKVSNGKSHVRVSSAVSQVVEIVSPEGRLPEMGAIVLTGPDNTPVDVDQVPYYDTVILSPQAPDHVTWRFKVVEPVEEAVRFLQNPDNLIQLPGFYKTKNLVASRSALGLKRGALKASTKYTFQVEFESKFANHTGSVRLTFNTMAAPQLRFLPLSQAEGTTDTVFFAKAISSVDAYSFKYYFLIKLQDGSEVCMDGCSGHRSVSFRVPVEGDHVIRCVLVDARGKYVLAQSKETRKVIIRRKESAEDVTVEKSRLIFDSLQLGDHSTFSLACISLAAYAKTVDPNQGEESRKVGNLVSSTLEQLSQLYRKSQTNTPLAKDYMKITQIFASLPAGHEGLATERAFYHLCQMMHYAVSNTPSTERFDMANDLNMTLSYLRVQARQIFSFGSSRERLVQGAAGGPSDVNEKLLELSEMTVPLWATMRGRDAVCGEKISDEVGGVARVSTGTYCTKEHGLSMTGVFSRLDWCEGMFGTNGIQRTRVVLGEFHHDYIAESGVLRIRRHAAKLPTVSDGSVSISTEDMASHGYGIVRTIFEPVDDGAHFHKGCLQLTQTVRPTGDVFRTFGGGIICDSATGLVYINIKNQNERLKSGAYAERALPSKGLNVSGTLARQEIVEVTSEIEANGRYGVKRKQCKHVKATTFGIVNGIWIPIVFSIGVCLLTLLVVVSGVKIGESRAIGVTAETGTSTYIERDIYGRDAHYMEDTEADVNQNGDDTSRVRTGVEKSADGNADGDEVVFERRPSGGGG